MQEDYSVRMWFRTTDPHLKELDKFERDFGNDQSVLVGVYDKGGLFTKDNIQLIQTLTDEAWKMTDIVRVDSLTNYNYVSVDGDNIQVDPFLSPERELTQDLLNQKKDLAVNHRIMLNRFINSAGTLALIHAQMVPKYDGHESNYRIITSNFKTCLIACRLALSIFSWAQLPSMMLPSCGKS